MNILDVIKLQIQRMTPEEHNFYIDYLEKILPYKVGDYVYINKNATTLHDLCPPEELENFFKIKLIIVSYHHDQILDYIKYNKKEVYIYYARSVDYMSTVYNINNYYRINELIPELDNTIITF